VRLVEDLVTGLIYNNAFLPELITYDANYHNEQEGSFAFREHLEEVAAICENYLPGKTFFEIGCGKAHFLNYLGRRGYEVRGIDPAYEGTDQRVIRAFHRQG